MPEESPGHYLDHACLGRPSPKTLAAVQRTMQYLASFDSPGTPATLHLFQSVEEARRQIAGFIHADPSGVVLVESTTHGLGIIASSLPLSQGDNVLIDDLEFLSAPVVWRAVCRRLGVEIRAVETEGGRVLADHFARHADARTRALVLSSVQEVSGYRADLAALREIARSHGAFLILDGIQEVGALPVDLTLEPVDAYCAGGHKWLRSPFGAGFLYVHQRLLERLQPPSFGYLALAEPADGWERYLQSPERTPFDHLPELADVRRLQPGGTPNWLGAIALQQAVGELQQVGQQEIWGRILRLTGHLRAGLKRLGLSVLGEQADSGGKLDAARRHQSGIVCFGLPGGLPAERALFDRLVKARVYVSLRYISGVGGIRVSPHYDNTLDDIAQLLAITAEFLKR